jgi:hypothetical protein
MRRTVFILLIVVVIAIVAVYTFLEFRVNEIVFVSHNWDDTLAHGKEFVYRRLYNSNVDIEAFRENFEQLLIEPDLFTDEEFDIWALYSGNPELYLAFYYSVYPYYGTGFTGGSSVTSDENADMYIFSGRIVQESALGQTNFNFHVTDLYLEVTTTPGLQILLLDDLLQRTDRADGKFPGTPVLSEDGRSLAVELGDILDYSFHLSGTGTVTIKYTYNIATNNIFARRMLEEQFLRINVMITSDEDGGYSLRYNHDPYLTLEQYREDR